MNFFFLADSAGWIYDQLGVAILAILAVGALWKHILNREKYFDKERQVWQLKFDNLVTDHSQAMEVVYLRMADSERANLETLKDIASCMDSVTKGQDETQQGLDGLKTIIINGITKN